ncbi:MAG: DUF6916 family protein [Gammaproteobacteria bacterium]
MLETLTKEWWSEYLGGSFELMDDGGGTMAMVLAEVTSLGTGAGDRRDPYSLVFRGPLSPILPQRIYQIRHDRMGDLDLFLVPIGPDGEGMRYEAIFT